MKERQAVNKEHAINPKVGDYWSDHLCPMVLVKAVTSTHVTIIQDVERDSEGWMWDFSKSKTITREQFESLLSYETIPGYWADVLPEGHKNLLKQASPPKQSGKEI